MKTRHTYPQKFREDAVQRYRAGGITHQKLAAELGVNAYTLRSWIWYPKPANNTEVTKDDRAPAIAALQAEAEALCRENKTLTEAQRARGKEDSAKKNSVLPVSP
jgi:transposase-like protein